MRSKKFLVLMLLIIMSMVLIIKFNFLSFEKLIISSDVECVTKQQLENEVNISGKNIFFLNQNKIKNVLLTRYLCIKDIDMSFEFPRNLKMTIYGRKYMARVISLNQIDDLSDLESSVSSETALIDWNFPTVSSGEALIADDTGLIFTKKQLNFSLPTLFLTEELMLGKQLDRKYINSFHQIVTRFLQLDPISSEPNFSAKKIGNTLVTNTSIKIAFSLERDILKQLASLQLILQKAKIDGRMAQVIDLRFDKPVIEFLPKLSK